MSELLQGQPEEEHVGEKYLKQLNLDYMIDEDVTRPDGSIIKGRDFLTLCGEHALPALAGLNDMKNGDPVRYEKAKVLLRNMVLFHLQPKDN